MCHSIMTEKDLEKKFENLISNACTPVLKEFGFKKSGTNFYRQTEELVQTFNVQKSPFNNKNDLSFTGNIGIIEPDTYLKLHEVESLPRFPKCTDAIIQFRLGLLTDKTDYWYRLTPTSDIKAVATKLQRDIKAVQEFFESHRTVHSLDDLIGDRTKFNPFWGEAGQFALLKKLGKDEEASRIIASVYAKAKTPKSCLTITERIKGIWTDTKPAPAVNTIWVERIQKVAELYHEKLT